MDATTTIVLIVNLVATGLIGGSHIFDKCSPMLQHVTAVHCSASNCIHFDVERNSGANTPVPGGVGASPPAGGTQLNAPLTVV